MKSTFFLLNYIVKVFSRNIFHVKENIKFSHNMWQRNSKTEILVDVTNFLNSCSKRLIPVWESAIAFFKSSISFKTPGLFSLGVGLGASMVFPVDSLDLTSSPTVLIWFFKASTWFGMQASLLKFSVNLSVIKNQSNWHSKFSKTFQNH